MDNLTHSLTGLMMSRAGLSRFHARAPLALILSANAPDIDGLSLLGGPLTYIRYHRGLAHSIAFLPVVSLLPLVVVLAIARSARGFVRLYCLCLAGVASHLLLDSTNTYGIRLLLPFRPDWLALDLNNLVDAWIWGVLLFAWLMVYLIRLVSREIGAKPASGRGLAIFALSFILVYDYGRYLSHSRAIEIMNSRVYDGNVPVRVAAFPLRSNPFAWRGWVETPAFFKRFDIDVLSNFDPGSGATFYKPQPSPAIEAAKASGPFRQFITFAQYPRWDVVPEPEGVNRVELKDLRLSFAAVALVDRNDSVLRAWFHF